MSEAKNWDEDDASTDAAMEAVRKAKRVHMELKGIETGPVKIGKTECLSMLRAHSADERANGTQYSWMLIWDVDWLTLHFNGTD